MMESEQEPFECPLSFNEMVDPVIDPEGNSYEREAIERWLSANGTSPMTREQLSLKSLVPNRALRAAIELRKHDRGLPTELKIPESEILLDEKLVNEESLRLGVWHGTSVAIQPIPYAFNAAFNSTHSVSVACAAFRREFELIYRLRHPNITALLGCIGPTLDGSLCLVLEWGEQGCLSTFTKNCGTCLPIMDAIGIGMDIARGLCFLHVRGFAHGNLKSSNIMISCGRVAKITYLGLLRNTEGVLFNQLGKTRLCLSCTNPHCRGPITADKALCWSQACDIHSMGNILWELADGTGRECSGPPSIGRECTQDMPERSPPALVDLIQQCWKGDPSERPVAQSVVDGLALAAKQISVESQSGGCEGRLAIEVATVFEKFASQQPSNDVNLPNGCLDALVSMVSVGSVAQHAPAVRILGYMSRDSRLNQNSVLWSGAIEQLVAIIRDGTSDQKELAAGALEALAEGNHSNKDCIRAAGARDALTVLANSGTPAQRARAAVALKALCEREVPASVQFSDRLELSKAERMPAILNSVDAGNALVLAPLSSSATDDDLKAAVSNLLTLIRSDNPNLRERAVWDLRVLLKLDRNASCLINAAGGIMDVVRIVNTGLQSAKEHAAAALKRIASSGLSLKDAVCEAGGAEALVRLLNNGTAGQRGQAAGALAHLSNGNCSNQQAVIAAGGAQSLLACLCQWPLDKSAIHATTAITSLASGPVEIQKALVQAGAVQSLVARLQDNADAIKNAALAALFNLATFAGADPDAIRLAGGVEPLVSFVRFGTNSQRQYAVGLLQAMTRVGQANRDAISSVGGKDILVELAELAVSCLDTLSRGGCPNTPNAMVSGHGREVLAMLAASVEVATKELDCLVCTAVQPSTDLTYAQSIAPVIGNRTVQVVDLTPNIAGMEDQGIQLESKGRNDVHGDQRSLKRRSSSGQNGANFKAGGDGSGSKGNNGGAEVDDTDLLEISVEPIHVAKKPFMVVDLTED